MEKLTALEHQRARDSTTLMGLSVNTKQKRTSATAGCPVTNKKTTCKGKSSTCGQPTQTTELLPMLAADSASEEKDLLPYWNAHAAELSETLWLPTRTDSLALDSTLLSGSLRTMADSSWFSTIYLVPHNKSLLQTCCPLSQYSPVECTDYVNTKLQLKTVKIRIYPTADQRTLLKQWMGTARVVYNHTVAYLKQEGTKASWKSIKTGLITSMPAWADSVPYQIRSIAVRDACFAVMAAKRKYLLTGEYQEVSFKSKKQFRDSVYLPRIAIKDKSFYTRYLGKHIKYAEPLPTLNYDCRVTHDHGKFYLCAPVEFKPTQPDNQRLGLVALDPGVRTFQTFYNYKLAGKIGENNFSRIYRLCNVLDKLMSKRAKAKCKAKRRLSKAASRLREKIKNLVNEIHHKTANFLCNTFDVILLPTFETSQMVTKLRDKTARAMLTWAHYRFKMFLKHKAKQLGAVVLDTNEAYTSKTCSACGRIQNIGSKKVMHCKCGVSVDRDINGARGITLRALIDTSLFTKVNMHLLAVGNNC